MAKDDPPVDDYYFSRTQRFDVVLMKKGVNGMEAKPDDFTRVSVTADSVSLAEQDPAVAEAQKAGFSLYRVTAPGYTTEFEIEARRRAHDAVSGEPDRRNI